MNNLSHEYIISVELPKIFQAIDEFWKPQDRGFELVDPGTSIRNRVNVLYQSNQCKVRILCFRDRPWENIEIDVSYGRLHAPVDKEVIDWNSEKSYCWHSIISAPILSFLDGTSAVETANLRIPNTFQDFLRISKGKDWTIPERFSREQEFIWDYYGQGLFDLFDLHHTELWDEYVRFLKKYDHIKQEQNRLSGRNTTSIPPKYMVC